MMLSLIDKLNLWTKLIGIDFDSNKKSSLDWETENSHKRLLESIDLDKSGVTTNLILEYYLDEYLSNMRYSLLDIVNDENKKIENKIYLSRQLKESLTDENTIALKNEFLSHIKKSLSHYDVDFNNEIYSKLLENKYILSILRRDAFSASQKLRKFQFYVGSSESSNFKPKYLKSIYKWFNINSLIQSVSNIPSGISLHLIQSPDKYQSYFLFCLKNGENIIIYTDKTNTAHPLQSQFSRRPDRDFSERADKNWFPYELLEYEYTEDMKSIYFKDTTSTDLVVKNEDFVVVEDLKNIDERSLIWIIMVFELIIEKDWQLQLPELSYTNEMIVNNDLLLLAKSKTEITTINEYKKLELDELSVDDVLNATTKELGSMTGNKGAFWLIERYKDKINQSLLNKIAFNKYFLIINNELKEVKERDYSSWSIMDKDIKIRVSQIDPTDFGTKESIEKDRIFIARYNLASAISHLAEIEYESRKKELVNWYHSSLVQNQNNIIKMMYKKEIISSSDKYRKLMTTNEESPYNHVYDYAPLEYIINGFCGNCFFTEAKVSHHFLFDVHSINDLMLLTGINDINLIPDVLRNIYDPTDSSGNHLLRRIDPMLWNLHDPFVKFNFKFRIDISKRIYNKIIKGQDLL